MNAKTTSELMAGFRTASPAAATTLVALGVRVLIGWMMDGPVLIRTLRNLDADVKTICVSGLASEHKLAEIDKSQVCSFITKPFTSATLLTTLRQVITSY